MTKYTAEGFKHCSKCSLHLPESPKFFRFLGKRFASQCILCERDGNKARRDLVKPQVIPHQLADKPVRTWKSHHVFFGDIHFPFHSKPALNRALEYVGDTKPDYVWQMADLFDQFAWSKYSRSHNVMTPRQEANEGKFYALQMWAEVQRRSPETKCRQLAGGNHDERLIKRILELAPEAEDFVVDGMDNLYTFPGVLTYKDSKQEVFEDGLCLLHGYKKFGEHAPHNQMNTITGHTHHGGVLFFQNVNGVFFELNVGWLGDKNAPVFNYKNQNRLSNTTVGIGEIDAHGPRFIPFW